MRWEQLIVTGASALTTILLARKLRKRSGSNSSAAAALQRDMRVWTPSAGLAPGLSDAQAVVTLVKPSAQRSSAFTTQLAVTALVACAALVAGAAGGMALGFRSAAQGVDQLSHAPWHAWHPSSATILAAVALLSFCMGAVCASASVGPAGEDGHKPQGLADGAQAGTTPQPPPARINPELSGTWVKVSRRWHGRVGSGPPEFGSVTLITLCKASTNGSRERLDRGECMSCSAPAWSRC